MHRLRASTSTASRSTGNTLLPRRKSNGRSRRITGKGKDFSDVQRALEAVEQAYRDRGYGIVQVLLPEQDITRGVVRFRVLEPRVGRVIDRRQQVLR